LSAITEATGLELLGDLAPAPEADSADRPRVPSGWAVASVGWILYTVLVAVLWHQTQGDWRWSEVVFIAAAHAAFWALATPAVVWLARRIEPARVGLPVTIALHAAAALACSLAVMVIRRWIVRHYGVEPVDSLLANFLFWLDVNVIAYATIAIVSRSLDLHRRYRDHTVRTHMLELQLSRAQMQFLELQLQPHFLFNCLNSVSELAHEAPDAAERMLRQLHALLRISLERAGQDEVTLDEELTGLDPYTAIQRTRFSEWLTVEHRIDPAARDALVPHLILQPLVENAIRHGLAVRSGPGRVEVGAAVDGDTLRLWVFDDGVGLAPVRPQPRRGIGLRNTRDRLRQLYDPNYRFVVRAAPLGGTLVELDIPLRRRDHAGRTPPLAGLVRDAARERALETPHPGAAEVAARGRLALVPAAAANGAHASSLDDLYSNIEMQSALVTGGWAAARRPTATPSSSPPTSPPEPATPKVPIWIS
jgi:two-component system, LytTR family, sensor kinase